MTFVKTTRKNKSHWFYQLLMALPISLAVAFGLSLWQTGGKMLFNKNISNETAKSDFSWFNFEGLIPTAFAQACTGNPTPPPSGAGAIYYNSCSGVFRAYENNTWVELSSYYWSFNGGNLYPDDTAYKLGVGNALPATKLHVTGQLFVDSSTESFLYTGTTGRDVLILKGAATESLNVIKTLNSDAVGFWSDNKNPKDWANLVAGTLYAKSFYVCTNPAVPATCLPFSADADSLWDYKEGTQTIYNINDSGAGVGVVEINDTLYVNSKVIIQNIPPAGSPWVDDLNNTVVKPGLGDLGCSSASNCVFYKIYSSGVEGSETKFAVGPGGVAMISQNSGNWSVAAQYAAGFAGGPVTVGGRSVTGPVSVWLKGNDTAYAIIPVPDPNGVAEDHGLAKWAGGSWNYVCTLHSLCNNTQFQTDPDSRVWGFQNSNYVFYTWPTNGGSVRYYNNGAIGSVGVSSSKDYAFIGGSNNTNRMYLASDYLLTNINFAVYDVNLSNASVTTHIVNYSIPGINPNVMAVDENGDNNCQTCVVLAGVNTDTTDNSDNVKIGSGASTGWKDVRTINVVGDTGVPKIDYNDPAVTWYDAWVGDNGNIIVLSGVRSGTNIIIYSRDGGNTWEKNSPADDGFICTGTCLTYAVSGNKAGLVSAVQTYTNLYRKQFETIAITGGTLEVAGNITAEGNTWGSEVIKHALPTSGVSCDNGYFVVKYQVIGSEVYLTCRKL